MSVELYNDNSVIDACISFATYTYVGNDGTRRSIDVNPSSATACRRLPARASISYDIGPYQRLVCVSSASTIAAPLIIKTQLR